MRSPRALFLTFCLAGCEAGDGAYADRVLEAPSAGERAYGDPDRATNGVFGGGCCAGSTDVFALGQQPAVDDWVVLGWSGASVRDGDGADLVVFENPFEHQGGVFVEAAVVEVRADGGDWVAFPHDYVTADEASFDGSIEAWSGFAGVRPVLLHDQDYPVDPRDTDLAGGDPFDLADLPAGPAADAIAADGACCVRITSARDLINPDTDLPYPTEPSAGAPDIDGVWGNTRPH